MGTEVSDQTAERIDGHSAMGPEAAAAVVQMVARLFDHWRLDASDQAALLGQPVGSSCSLSGHEIVASNETVERMGHLLAIHSKLRTLFPANRELAYAWMSTGSKAFDGLTPVAVVRAQGLVGLHALRVYLNRAIDG
jgi:hypothetical protein